MDYTNGAMYMPRVEDCECEVIWFLSQDLFHWCYIPKVKAKVSGGLLFSYVYNGKDSWEAKENPSDQSRTGD